MSSNNTASQIYSYHTFLLAFHYDGDNKPAENGNWKKDDLMDFSKSNITDEEKRLNYQRIQYFTPEARSLLFDKDNHFVYDLSGKEATYKIVKEQTEYVLDVNSIRAILFEGNIGVLIIELENTKYQSIEDVNKINEYGRRINLPYIGKEGEPHALVANKITFLGETEDFVQKGKDILSQDNIDDLKDGYIMKPVEKLLDELLPQHGKIVPVLDDRMFVCCMVRDAGLSEEVTSVKKVDKTDEHGQPVKDEKGKTVKVEVEKEGKGIYLDRELSKKIYSLAFIDAEWASCQSVEMREEILKRCIDSRWRDWGTIDVITHHSLIRITGGVELDFIVPSVVNPFLIQYVYLAIGALVQRATILSLSAESAEISNKYLLNDFSEELNNELKNLKKKYVYAQNNIFLHELTVQEQGVEEFDMLKNELYIDNSLENLNNKIDGLYGYVKEYSDDKRARLERESDAEKARLERESDKKEERKFNMLGILFGLMFITEPIANILRGFIDWIIGLFGLGPTDSDLAVGIIWFILASIGFLMIDKHYELLLFRKKTR